MFCVYLRSLVSTKVIFKCLWSICFKNVQFQVFDFLANEESFRGDVLISDYTFKSPREFLKKHRFLGPTPRNSNLIGLGWGPGKSIFLKASEVILICSQKLKSVFWSL